MSRGSVAEEIVRGADVRLASQKGRGFTTLFLSADVACTWFWWGLLRRGDYVVRNMSRDYLRKQLQMYSEQRR